MKKLTLLIAGGIGYVLGTRAGRQRYEQIRTGFDKVRQNPTVQSTAQQAADVAKEKAPMVKEKVSGVAGVAAEKVRPGSGGGGGSTSEDALPEESLVNQEDPYPKGDLP